MSELINNAEYRKKTLKSLILKLHDGVNPEQVRAELLKTLQHIPYGEVVEVERMAVWLVADFEALSCQVTTTFDTG